ncbi:ABC transporter permease [Dictyobacter arantiisoli]|uniref:Sugar ABC transporter permease n=1 Tax=Dictyobacter arantiisoli TaxID=2014874 RepID=A0A5A5T6W6_9CHLR|nr:ABC transporter permease [Dictyobacter arantiisoli]GCF07118.1 sugar ABC transporter permease [Dictyobacter arantiisoli]
MAQIATPKNQQARSASNPWATAITIIRQQGALIALVLVFVISSISFNGFLTSYNILDNVLVSNVPIGLIALGMTFVIITGGIDLSVGSTIALSSVVVALTSSHGMWFALAAAVLTGLAVGLFNGFIITQMHVPPFVATLATLLGVRGLALYFSNEHNVTVMSSDLINFGNGDLFGIPNPVIVLVVAFLIGMLVLNYSRFARHLLAIGGNAEAARLLGVRVNSTLLGAYMLSGALAGLAGVFIAIQTFSGSGNLANGYELSAIAAVVVGGTLISGGEGSVFGTFVGVLLLGFILNILNFLSGAGVTLNPFWQDVVRGAFLLVVILLQSRLANKKLERV